MRSFLGICLFTTFLFTMAEHGLAAPPLSKRMEKTIRNLRTYHPSRTAKDRIIAYAAKSSSETVVRGLELILKIHSEQEKKFRSRRRLIRRLRIDGRKNDWNRLNVIVNDKQNDTRKIDENMPSGVPNAADDLKSHAFVMDSRYLNVMVEPRRMPRRQADYHYRMNLFDENGNMIYAVVWSSFGNVIQEWDGATGEFLRHLPLRGSVFRKGRVFEARVPVRLLRRLPYQFNVQSVSWHNFKNLYDVNHNNVAGMSESEKYKETAIELLLRYGEEVDIPANNPFFVAQALSDAFIYKVAEVSLRPTIVKDGLAMINYAGSLGQSPFAGQAPLSEMSLEALLAWSNRSMIYGDYYAIDYYPARKKRFNREAYEFMILQPRTLHACRELLQSEGVIDTRSVASTADDMNNWLWSRNKYRRSNFADIEEMYMADPDNPWIKEVYEESLYEKNHGLTNITEVNGVQINKGTVYSPTFQIDYLRKHGLFYGNCVDVVAIESACLTAIGIPGIHVYYGLFSPERGKYTGYHSIWMYYSSLRDKWVNFEKSDTEIDEGGDFSNSGLTVVWQISRPQIGSFWESRWMNFSGKPLYFTPRNVYGSMTESKWWKIYAGGYANGEIVRFFGIE